MDDVVVITGTGLVCSLGHSTAQVWNALLSGTSGIRPIEGFDAQGFDCRAAAQVRGVDRGDIDIQPRLAEIMGKHLFMLMKCSRDALEQCNLSKVPGEEIGFFAGMGMVDYEVSDLLGAVLRSMDSDGRLNYDAFYSEGYQEIYPLWPLAMLNNVIFCQIAVSLDIRGENAVYCPHADSGVNAVAEGVNTILERKAQVVLAGGVSETVSPLSLARAHLSGILGSSDGAREAMCRPFAAGRNGTVMGEGCGMVALELRSFAEARGAQCLAVVSGFGSACEVEKGGRAPTKRAISLAMRQALAYSEINPSGVDAIIAHGDGTYLGDKNEIEAIHEVFENSVANMKVFSSKGALGHLLAASPAVDSVLAVAMLRNGIIPPTLNAAQADPTIRFHLVSGSPLQARPRRIMINASSYEGQCASLIIEAVD
jgi:3-oxoacyl-[acyl-carrier-protein] synthase II